VFIIKHLIRTLVSKKSLISVSNNKMKPVINKISNEPIKPSFFDEFPDDRKEYEIDSQNLWISWVAYQEIEREFPYFSKNPIEEGLLFKKSNKSAWFRNKFYMLYQDRLLYYKVPKNRFNLSAFRKKSRMIHIIRIKSCCLEG